MTVESITDLAADEKPKVVIYNPEQVEIINNLKALVDDTNAMIRLAASQSEENESLYQQVLDWKVVECNCSERWIDSNGALGWRVFIEHVSPKAARLFAFISGKLAEAGWDNVLVVAA